MKRAPMYHQARLPARAPVATSQQPGKVALEQAGSNLPPAQLGRTVLAGLPPELQLQAIRTSAAASRRPRLQGGRGQLAGSGPGGSQLQLLSATGATAARAQGLRLASGEA